jgi:hypothetical protein
MKNKSNEKLRLSILSNVKNTYLNFIFFQFKKISNKKIILKIPIRRLRSFNRTEVPPFYKHISRTYDNE